jgi:hypothetical protein
VQGQHALVQALDIAELLPYVRPQQLQLLRVFLQSACLVVDLRRELCQLLLALLVQTLRLR